MNHDEARQVLRDAGNKFLRVYATPKDGESAFMEYRFPGLTFTGYLIETGHNVLAFIDYLNIEKIEVW